MVEKLDIANVDAFEPIEDFLIVMKLKPDKTAGGILLPDKAKDAKGRFCMRGLILAAGPGKSNDDGTRLPMPVSKGETVLFSSLAGLELGEELRHELAQEGIEVKNADDIVLLRPADIVCKVKVKKKSR